MLAKNTREDELEELRGLIGQKEELTILSLTKYEGRLLGVLLKREIVSLETANLAMYHDRHADDRPDDRGAAVFLTHLRKKLDGEGIKIHNKAGEGWYMTPADKHKVQLLIEDARTNPKPPPSNKRTYASNQIVIEKDVPIPSRAIALTKYPFSEMVVGDSFFVKGGKTGSLSSAIRSWRVKNDRKHVKFAVRALNHEGGVRVWRIE